MATSSSLISILKKQIRLQGLNYKKVAMALGLSESAIKRAFATGNMSLARLDQICEVLGMDLHDVLALLEDSSERVDGLTYEDEQQLVSHPKLLLVAYCIVNTWTVETILQRYNLSETEVVKLLAQLDRMKMIELLPGNRVKTLVGNNFNWIANGPIERFFRSQVQHEFFSSTFSGDSDLHLVKMGDLTRAAQHRLVSRLHVIGQTFDEISRDERKVPSIERHGTTMVVAIRQWEYTAFAEFERDPRKRTGAAV